MGFCNESWQTDFNFLSFESKPLASCYKPENMESGISTPGLEASERSALLASDRAERGQYGFTADPTAKVKAPKGAQYISILLDIRM